MLPWSEVAAICGKRLLPLPPVGRIMVSSVLGRLGIDLPPEVLDLLPLGPGACTPAAQGGRLHLPAHGGRGHPRLRRGGPAAGRRRRAGLLPLRAGRRAVLPPLARGRGGAG